MASCSHPGGGGGGSTGTGGSGNCSPGTLGCACNGTSCNDGLSCATELNQCVSTASGSGGGTASGGATGSGGAISTGGDTGSGGSATGGTSGSGGAVSTGGDTGSGGSASGGDSGSGGSSAGPNLIDNGDFSQTDTNWHFENGTATVADGQYCETNITGSNALFGWQNATTPLMLSGSQMYTLTYKATGSGGAVIHVKVAHAVSPYTPDDYETNPDDQLTTTLQTFTHAFKPGQGDDSNTGVAFFVMSGQSICISSVSLVAH